MISAQQRFKQHFARAASQNGPQAVVDGIYRPKQQRQQQQNETRNAHFSIGNAGASK